MSKECPLVELAKKNRDAFWDANIAQATIDMKRIQVMLERVSHLSHIDIMQDMPIYISEDRAKSMELGFQCDFNGL